MRYNPKSEINVRNVYMHLIEYKFQLCTKLEVEDLGSYEFIYIKFLIDTCNYYINAIVKHREALGKRCPTDNPNSLAFEFLESQTLKEKVK